MDQHFVIDANFKPPAGLKFLNLVTAVMVALLVIASLTWAVSTALVVDYETKISDVSEKTRQYNEDIKNLQVKLHRVQSLQKVAKTAAHLSFLTPVADNRIVIDTRQRPSVQWPVYTQRLPQQLPPSQF